MPKKLTLKEFIEKTKSVHGDRYDYSEVKYINNNTKVCIICPQHGEFWQTPANHLSGQGCPKCANIKRGDTFRSTYKSFVMDAVRKHGVKYDYSKVNYVNNHTKVCIICPTHGEFWQKPHDHLEGHGCPKCKSEVISNIWKYTTDDFIKKAKKTHNDKYDYSKTDYKSANDKIIIICPIHGEFTQVAHEHLRGCGCPSCKRSLLEEDIAIFLRSKSIIFETQHSLEWLGKQNLDFYLPQYNTAIECQGLQHFEPIEVFGGEEAFRYRLELDERKRKLCNENGVKLLYYSNLGIEYPYKVFEDKEKLLNEIIKE